MWATRRMRKTRIRMTLHEKIGRFSSFAHCGDLLTYVVHLCATKFGLKLK